MVCSQKLSLCMLSLAHLETGHSHSHAASLKTSEATRIMLQGTTWKQMMLKSGPSKPATTQPSQASPVALRQGMSGALRSMPLPSQARRSATLSGQSHAEHRLNCESASDPTNQLT